MRATGGRTLVWGAGAIGGTLGAYLARAGRALTLVDVVPEHVAAIRSEGLRIEGPLDTFTQRMPAFLPGELSGQWDDVILATKAHHTEAAVRALAPHVTPEGHVVSAQNGLNEIAIAEVVGAARTIGAFVNFGADYLGPGVIHVGGRGAVVVGELDGRLSERVVAIRDAWRAFHPGAIATTNIWGYLWGKQAYGAMLFASALSHDSIADVLADAAFRPVLIALAREALAVAAARGVVPEAFDGFDPNAYAPDAAPGAAEASLDALVAHNRRSAKTHSGVWRDLAVRKRPTEVDAQVGMVVRLGAEAGVPAPLSARLVALVHEIERGQRAQGREAFLAIAGSDSTASKSGPGQKRARHHDE